MSLLDHYQAFYGSLKDFLSDCDVQKIIKEVESAYAISTENGIQSKQHGDLQRWCAALEKLPDLKASSIDIQNSRVRIGLESDCDSIQRDQLESSLRELHPWRKGPFSVFGIAIETEWRSDWKWDRLSAHIAPLKNRRVLDVGCGNGYHCWRMAGEGAKMVLGIDPTLVFIMQYQALHFYMPEVPVSVLPLALENMPANTNAFDTVFSMGVLYHRRSPLEHLDELYQQLRVGGELVLETLVIAGDQESVLMPEGRYAMMRNVWAIPSCAILIKWLQQSGFCNCRVIDVNQTTVDEQHSTDWMRFDSLPNFLDPRDSSKTIEGYPAPRRAIVLADKR